MRLRNLDLVRYGCFTDSSIELPARSADFHIVFGPNEAGKSTALTAIGDLLFGIPTRSPYNFLHAYKSMRIGAELENGSSSLEILRRKGSKNTLLRADGLPIAGGEGALRLYLAGADRSFFERMFSLDHARLRAGGQEILEARGDVGQMLFSAGAGIVGLRKRLGELSAEAEVLWDPHKAKHRKFYIAYDKFTEAKRSLREHSFTTTKWSALKRTYKIAEDAYVEVSKLLKETSAERNRLSRIRRVFRNVRRKQELDGQLAELGDVIALSVDAAQVVAKAERGETEAATRTATLKEQLKLADKNLGDLTFDEVLIQRSEDVGQLHERRIEVRSEKADLPKREAELNAAEEELRAYASEVEWSETDSATLIERIPPRAKVRVVRILLNQRGKLEAKVTSHTRLLQESQETYSGLKKRLDEMGEPVHASKLAIVLRTLRAQGELTGLFRTAEKAFGDAQRLVKYKLSALNPGGTSEDTLANMIVPALAQVQDYRVREQEYERRLRDTRQEVWTVQQELNGAVAAFDRRARDGKVITGEALHDARSYRDILWHLVTLTYVRGESISDDQASGFEEELEDLAGAFESAMTTADDLSDRRFDHAEAAGRIAEIKRKIGEQEILLEQKKENQTKLAEQGKQLQTEWSTMWAEAPFDPLTAMSMLEWLEAREKVLEAVQEREDAAAALEALSKEEREAKQQVLNELAVLGVNVAVLENDSLNVIIERAAEEQRLREDEVRQKVQLEEEATNAAEEVTRRKREFREAKEARDEWHIRWTDALDGLGLARSTAPEAVEELIDIIDLMRETASRIRSLQNDRIDKIKRDIADFEQAVIDLVKDLAEDLLDQPAEHALLKLETRFADAQRIQGLRKKKNQEVKGLVAQIAKLEKERRDLTASISDLKTAAAVDTIDALKEAIKRSDQRRSFDHERQQIINTLTQDGDGKTIEELVEECKGVDIDDVAARDVSIQSELEDLHRQQTNAATEQSRAREAFLAVGGGDAAARAAASEQEALAEMRNVAEQYIRMKISAILLQWGIDRYRREKQGPLLKRAGELFKVITCGSFSCLQVDFDDQDNAHLTGIRPNGSIVPVSGMSTGTADQLYLTLRVASIENYLEQADALPFIADDLFINFDNERAAAGFTLLGELSNTTQVVFFTHHQHLVDIAKKSLGTSVSMVTLANQ